MQTTYDNTLSVYYEDNGSDSRYKIEMGPDFCVLCKIWEWCVQCSYHGGRELLD